MNENLFLLILSPITALIPALLSIYLVIKKKFKIYKNIWNIGLLGLWIWSTIGAVVNRSFLSFLMSFSFLIYYFLSQYIHNIKIDCMSVEKIIEKIYYFSIIPSIIGILEKIIFVLVDKLNHRIYSTFGNPNIAGDWFVIIILFGLYLINKTNDKKLRYRYIGLIFIYSITLLLTGSRGAFVSLFASSIAMYIFLNKKSKVVLILIAVIQVIVLRFGFLENKASKVTTPQTISYSFTSRDAIWKGSINMAKEKPILGWGIFGTKEAGKYYIGGKGNIHSHNLWLSFIVMTGVVGLVIYLTIKGKMYLNLYKLYRDKNQLVPLFVGINSVFVVHGLIDFTIMAPQLGIIFVCTSAFVNTFANDEQIILKSKKVLVNNTYNIE